MSVAKFVPKMDKTSCLNPFSAGHLPYIMVIQYTGTNLFKNTLKAKMYPNDKETRNAVESLPG